MSSSNTCTCTTREPLHNEEYLHCLHSKVLEDNRDFLCRDGRINPRHHYPFLRSKRILSREICAEIDNIPGPSAKANRFIDELQRNGSQKALVYFLESLRRDGTQIFILKRLNQALDNLLHNPPPFDHFEYSDSPTHSCQFREIEESSIVSEGDVASSMSLLTDTLAQPHPRVPPLPSVESLVKCNLTQGPVSDDEVAPETLPGAKLLEY